MKTLTTKVDDRDLTRLQRSTIALVRYLDETPPVEDAEGRALAALHRQARCAGAWTGSEVALRDVLARLDRRGAVWRCIHGRRTYAIGSTLSSTPPVDGWLERLRGHGTTELEHVEHVEVVDDADGLSRDELEVAVDTNLLLEHAEQHDAELEARPALVAPRTVRLELELPIAVAHQVLELVAGAGDVRPADIDYVKRAVAASADRVDRAAMQTTTRLMDRVNELEAQTTALGSALRDLGGNPAKVVKANGKVTKPDFRALGVKDSAQRRLLVDLALDGWKLEKANGGHVKASKAGHKPVLLASTPSDHRTPMNDRSRARSAGAAV